MDLETAAVLLEDGERLAFVATELAALAGVQVDQCEVAGWRCS